MEHSLIARPRALPARRSLQKVPYVELFDGRLQGVVSSGSSSTRVYVLFVAAGSGDFYCSTNNNRPCGGLGASYCSHLDKLIDNGIAQLGADRVARYLGCADRGIADAHDIARQLGGAKRKEEAAPSSPAYSTTSATSSSHPATGRRPRSCLTLSIRTSI